jgi:hypothetical protein
VSSRDEGSKQNIKCWGQSEINLSVQSVKTRTDSELTGRVVGKAWLYVGTKIAYECV